MHTDMKIGLTLLFIGFIGMFINMFRAADPSKLKNHLYSTILAGISATYLLIEAIWF